MKVDCSGCPTTGTIYGDEIYTDDSNICRAAAHEGRFGVLVVEGLAGQSSYAGVTRNGITSKSWSSWPGSFKFVKKLGCDFSVEKLSVGERLEVDCNGCPTAGSIYGDGIYTHDSNICRAAAHDGRFGVLVVERLAGQSSYASVTRNGITSKRWGSWPGSFKFVSV